MRPPSGEVRAQPPANMSADLPPTDDIKFCIPSHDGEGCSRLASGGDTPANRGAARSRLRCTMSTNGWPGLKPMKMLRWVSWLGVGHSSTVSKPSFASSACMRSELGPQPFSGEAHRHLLAGEEVHDRPGILRLSIYVSTVSAYLAMRDISIRSRIGSST